MTAADLRVSDRLLVTPRGAASRGTTVFVTITEITRRNGVTAAWHGDSCEYLDDNKPVTIDDHDRR